MDRWSFYYILDGRDPVPADDMEAWGECMCGPNAMATRRVAWDEVAPGVTVSTVFTGYDQSLGFGDGPPLVFETMVFDDYDNNERRLYSTWDEAAAGHKKMVEEVRAKIENDRLEHDG